MTHAVAFSLDTKHVASAAADGGGGDSGDGSAQLSMAQLRVRVERRPVRVVTEKAQTSGGDVGNNDTKDDTKDEKEEGGGSWQQVLNVSLQLRAGGRLPRLQFLSGLQRGRYGAAHSQAAAADASGDSLLLSWLVISLVASHRSSD